MKKFLLFTAYFCIAFTLLQANDIVLPNGSFEKLNKAGDWPLKWNKNAKSKGQLKTGDAAEGKNYLRFEKGYAVLDYTFKKDIPGGTELELSAMARGGGDCKFGISVTYKTKNSQTGKVKYISQNCVYDKPLTDKWQKFSGKVKLRKNIVPGELIIGYYRTNRKGFLELDDVKISSLSSEQPAAAPTVKIEENSTPAPAETAPAAPASAPSEKITFKPSVNLPSLPTEVRTELTPREMYLTLPEIIYAVPGIESNIFFENVVDCANINAYAVEVKSKAGKQFCNRWAWTPNAEDAGKNYELELTLFNDHGKVISGKTRICVAKEPADRSKAIRLALLGDSLLLCKYPEHLRDTMIKNGFVNYVPVGSYTPSGEKPKKGDMAHDAYGGFTWSDFITRWRYSAKALAGVQDKAEREQMLALGVINVPKSQDYRQRSPLLHLENGKPVLDIPNWFKRINNGNAPEVIIIELGGNDVFDVSASNLDKQIAKVMKNVRILLAELRKHAPDTLIGVTTGQLGAAQDAFGFNYGCMQSAYQYRRNIQRYNREISKLIKELKDPAIELIPIHQSIDPLNSYIKQSHKVSKRSKTKTMMYDNALHPNLEGGYQVGDAIYCYLIHKF